MSNKEWFRNSNWTTDVKTAFFERLDRTRTSLNKAQYLRIQALHLQETGKKKHIRAALELLDLMLEKWSEESELASAYLQQAQCFEYLHDYESAVNSFRNSIKAEKEFPGVRVHAAIHFGWFVIQRGIKELYEEVLISLNPDEGDLVWPVYQFKFFCILAFILDYQGETAPSKRFAKTALEAMEKAESPFRYHKKLGLVQNPNRAIVKKLKKIIAK